MNHLFFFLIQEVLQRLHDELQSTWDEIDVMDCRDVVHVALA